MLSECSHSPLSHIATDLFELSSERCDLFGVGSLLKQFNHIWLNALQIRSYASPRQNVDTRICMPTSRPAGCQSSVSYCHSETTQWHSLGLNCIHRFDSTELQRRMYADLGLSLALDNWCGGHSRGHRSMYVVQAIPFLAQEGSETTQLISKYYLSHQ